MRLPRGFGAFVGYQRADTYVASRNADVKVCAPRFRFALERAIGRCIGSVAQFLLVTEGVPFTTASVLLNEVEFGT